MGVAKWWGLVVVAVASVVGAVEVEVGGGRVRGAVKTSWSGRQYHAFHAIPYAQPPIDRNRFMPPLPGAEWSGVLDASEPGEPCAQAALGHVRGIEDCLNLYVYTTKVAEEGNNGSLPVVVWLHGGSFVVGGAADLDPGHFMDRDLVLVVPQYRLGILGFFSTPTGSSPGNMGMMDQVVALRWVQDNIAVFGGDPKQVTVAGDCAGGAAALYHMMSPLSKGLFHRVVSLSGSPLNPWAIYRNNYRFMLILANHIKCPAYDQALLVQCFQELELSELLEGAQNVVEARDPIVGNHRLSPVVQEPANSHVTTLFLDQHPLAALVRGDIHHVPVLLSVTKAVGNYLLDMMFYEFLQYKMEDTPDLLEKLLNMLLREFYIHEFEEKEQQFRDYYFPGLTFSNLTQLLPGLAQMLGDIHYKAGIFNVAALLSQHVPVRLMRFEYDDGPKLVHLRHPDPATAPHLPPTVGHGDEMALLLPDQPHHLTPDQHHISNLLLDMIEDFANGRTPRDDWPLFSNEKHETLVVGEHGEVSSQPFTDPSHASMLYDIHSYHFHKVLAELDQEETVHDEL